MVGGKGRGKGVTFVQDGREQEGADSEELHTGIFGRGMNFDEVMNGSELVISSRRCSGARRFRSSYSHLLP